MEGMRQIYSRINLRYFPQNNKHTHPNWQVYRQGPQWRLCERIFWEFMIIFYKVRKVHINRSKPLISPLPNYWIGIVSTSSLCTSRTFNLKLWRYPRREGVFPPRKWYDTLTIYWTKFSTLQANHTPQSQIKRWVSLSIGPAASVQTVTTHRF